MLLLLCLWLIAAVVGSIIANAKNRSPIEGLLWGGLLSVLGLIILACLPSKVPADVPPKGMEAVKCPRCNAVQNVPREDTHWVCWQCHLD
jgi:hypothetical protein